MKELTFSEKISNKTKGTRIVGDNANNWTHRESLVKTLELKLIARALCMKISEKEHTYAMAPERKSDDMDTDFRHGTIPPIWNAIAMLENEYNGFLISSYDNKSIELLDYRDKIRIIRLVQKLSKNYYSGKKQRIINALEKKIISFGKHTTFILKLLKQYNFNQLRKVKEDLTKSLLSNVSMPPDKVLKEISKYQ